VAVGHGAAVAAESKHRRGLAETRLAGAAARLPVSVRAKLLVGFAIIGGLLALVAVLGLLALRDSNNRGAQLRKLQQTAAYDQRLLGDALNLQTLFQVRSQLGSAYAVAEDTTIAIAAGGLQTDVGQRVGLNSRHAKYLSYGLTLEATDPGLAAQFGTRLAVLSNLATFTNPPAGVISVGRADANWMASRLARMAKASTARANALVAADHSAFADSRNLLLGVAGGSLAVAFGLALLLSWLVVTPLRRTESRLGEIAAGAFEGRLEVANRDEFGRLATRVNEMSDELGRLYQQLGTTNQALEAANHELATISRHKSDFLTNMSHELRTPLNAIIGFSEVLHEQMFGELNERQLAYVDDVLDAGRHLLSLINDVLDLAKIEAGRFELDLSQVAVPELLRGAVSMHSERADRGGITLALTTEPAQITVTADERRVRQIVFNLLSNAVKFTPPDGRIDITARQKSGLVEIAVTDTGPGIAPEYLESIFEEFEQTSDGRKAEGTGLGLPLSRKLAELHGGQLWAESQPGNGSTFRFTLPIRDRA
jgi:signal transduction histidine kinase